VAHPSYPKRPVNPLCSTLFGFMPLIGLTRFSALPFKQIMDLLVAGSPAAAEMRDFITLDQIRHETEELSRQFPADQAYVAHVVFGRMKRS